MVTADHRDVAVEMHEIASLISGMFPDQCGRLHYLADVLSTREQTKATPASEPDAHEPRRPKAKARRGKGTAKMITRNLPKMRTCPHCGEEKKGQGFTRHEASCAIKHAPSAGDLLTPATP